MSSDISTEQVVDWTDLGREMWSFLTGREAAINGTALLRAGSRLNIGDRTMSFFREEYAGRAFGGRVGGEIGHQRPQPARHLRHPHPEENK